MRNHLPKKAAAKTTIVVLALAFFAIGLPVGLWLASIQGDSSVQPQTSPTQNVTPSPTQTPTATAPSTPSYNDQTDMISPSPPTPSNTPSALPTGIPSQSPALTPSPTAKPLQTPTTTYSPPPSPTHPPQGPGPSVTERILMDDSVKYVLDGSSYTEKAGFAAASNATMGNWSTQVTYSPLSWTMSTRVRLGISISISKELLEEMKARYPKASDICVLVTAERDFDPLGYQHVPWDNTVSTILTPSGLPIEGGGSSALSRFSGVTQRGPVDVMFEMPLSNFTTNPMNWTVSDLYGSFDLPNNMPPGIYRLRLDFGLKTSGRYMDFNGFSIGARPTDPASVSCQYSPPIPASGWDVRDEWVDGSLIMRKAFWVLLWDYNSNGYRGVVAQEDQTKVAISPRNIIHDAVILPKTNVNGNPLSYNLEPNFLFDNEVAQRNIQWNYQSGQWSVKVTLPNGTSSDLGWASFVARRGNGATTRQAAFTSWRPPMYGYYTIEAKGWIEDISGNRYEGGGTYSFWIAERLTVATATFQGMPYNVGNRYGRDLAFSPPVPANVTIKAQLFSNSDPNNVTTIVCSGKATPGGLFGTAQGMIALPFDSPGEYIGTVLATYTDSQGTLWVAAMTHAGVVYPTNSSIIAHGKKLTVPGGQLVDRGQTKSEGYVAANGTNYLHHINFPYNYGDSVLIASEYQGANKIEPVLTYEANGTSTSYDPALQTIGKTNLVIKTSNNLSPQMFPEYITDMQYYYGAAPQAGFNSRFIVAHDLIRAPYWPTSNNNFGGQYGASNNGDFPGVIYRLLGGIVSKTQNKAPAYAGYQASAFILPKGTGNNRIIGPGEEDLPSPDGVPARFFLVPVRPGSVYPLGATFGAVLQIDPIVPCNVTFTMTAPDNSNRQAVGQGDQYGYFASSTRWPLDQAGVWTYKINATWNGYAGRVPGLPDSGGWIYVLENGTAPSTGLVLNMPQKQTFSPTFGLNVTGQTTSSKVYVAAIIPGAILEQVILPVTNGVFRYTFDPQRMSGKIQTYDIVNLSNGKPEIGRVVHLTFFSEETGPEGIIYHSFARVVLRGTTAVYVKER